MAKTNTPKNKKPATAVRCKPTQLDRIEETAGTFHHTVTTALRNFDKRITEQGKVLDSICGSLALDMGDRLKSHADMLHKIQSDLSLMKSGASFMQELDRIAPQEEQGLEDGMYIRLRPSEVQSGSDRVRWAEGLIRQLPEGHNGRDSWLLNYAGDKHSADVVTAKKLGLVPREEPKEEWVPKVGELITFKDGSVTSVVKEVKYINDRSSAPCAYGDGWGNYVINIRPATPAEIADHEAKIKAKEEEQKLARLKPGVPIKYEGERWIIGSEGPSADGRWLVSKWDANYSLQAMHLRPSSFTIID